MYGRVSFADAKRGGSSRAAACRVKSKFGDCVPRL
jgi:hypothetical protein